MGYCAEQMLEILCLIKEYGLRKACITHHWCFESLSILHGFGRRIISNISSKEYTVKPKREGSYSASSTSHCNDNSPGFRLFSFWAQTDFALVHMQVKRFIQLRAQIQFFWEISGKLQGCSVCLTAALVREGLQSVIWLHFSHVTAKICVSSLYGCRSDQKANMMPTRLTLCKPWPDPLRGSQWWHNCSSHFSYLSFLCVRRWGGGGVMGQMEWTGFRGSERQWLSWVNIALACDETICIVCVQTFSTLPIFLLFDDR